MASFQLFATFHVHDGDFVRTRQCGCSGDEHEHCVTKTVQVEQQEEGHDFQPNEARRT